jgi:hypothetical protein
MKHTLIGLVIATLFGIGAGAHYGFSGLVEQGWVDWAFAGLILSGIALDQAGAAIKALRCRDIPGAARTAVCGQS